jgi:hypothetical protein
MLAAPVARQYTSKETQDDAVIVFGGAAGRRSLSSLWLYCIPSRSQRSPVVALNNGQRNRQTRLRAEYLYIVAPMDSIRQ